MQLTLYMLYLGDNTDHHCKCRLGKINAAANHWSSLCSYYSLTVQVKTVAMSQTIPPQASESALSLTKMVLLMRVCAASLL